MYSTRYALISRIFGLILSLSLLQITASSLDISAVKQRCRLSLNLSREYAVSESFSVKSQVDQKPYHFGKLDQIDISLSSELFIAPEMMYTSLDLPSRVAEATRDLPDHILKDCFSNIFITGKTLFDILPKI